MSHGCVFQWRTHRSARWYLIRPLKLTDAMADVWFLSDLFAQMPKAWFQLYNIWIHTLFPAHLQESNICRLSRFLLHLVWRWLKPQVTFHPCWRLSSTSRIYEMFTTQRMVLSSGLSTTLFFFFSGHEPPVMTQTLPMRDIGGKHCELDKCQGRQSRERSLKSSYWGGVLMIHPIFQTYQRTCAC